jgi:hypothetical protein
MSQHPVIDQSLTLLKTYQWGTLWKVVRTITPQTPVTERLPQPVKLQLLALKALMLAGWWESPHLTDELMPELYGAQTDPLVHFGCRYALMAKGDIQGLKELEKRQPAQMPVWMTEWLQLEFLGRSLQDKAQIQLVSRILKRHKGTLPDWVKVALLQSLAHARANLRFLQRLIEQQRWCQSQDPLTLALCLRARTITLPQLTEQLSQPLPPYLLWRQANQYWAEIRLLQAFAAYDQLMSSYLADITTLQRWLTLAVSLPEGRKSLLKRVNAAQAIAPDDPMTQGILASYGLIAHWLNGDMQAAYDVVARHHEVQHLPVNDLTKNAQIFFRYVLSLCVAWQHNPGLYQTAPALPGLHILGESHSLSIANVGITLGDQTFIGKAHFLMGIKMFHLARPQASYHASLLEARLATLPQQAHLLFTIGEIDARPDEGIWKNSYCKGQPYTPVVDETVNGYIRYLVNALKDKDTASVTLQGIPAPNYTFKAAKDPGDSEQFLAMIRDLNNCLKAKALQAGFRFLDVYTATVDPNTSKSNGHHHIDGYHLKPSFYANADQWLLGGK